MCRRPSPTPPTLSASNNVLLAPQLTLRRCDSVAVLTSCTNLQRLLLEDCRKLTDLSPLTQLPQLHTLLLRTMRHLADLKPVAQVSCS